jgi:hypothetical protein
MDFFTKVIGMVIIGMVLWWVVGLLGKVGDKLDPDHKG